MSQHPVHKSFGFAFSGIYHAIKENRNFRLEAYIGIGAVMAGKILELTRSEMIIVSQNGRNAIN